MNIAAIISVFKALGGFIKDKRNKYSSKRIISVAIVSVAMVEIELYGINVYNLILTTLGVLPAIFSVFEKDETK